MLLKINPLLLSLNVVPQITGRTRYKSNYQQGDLPPFEVNIHYSGFSSVSNSQSYLSIISLQLWQVPAPQEKWKTTSLAKHLGQTTIVPCFLALVCLFIGFVGGFSDRTKFLTYLMPFFCRYFSMVSLLTPYSFSFFRYSFIVGNSESTNLE